MSDNYNKRNRSFNTSDSSSEGHKLLRVSSPGSVSLHVSEINDIIGAAVTPQSQAGGSGVEAAGQVVPRSNQGGQASLGEFPDTEISSQASHRLELFKQAGNRYSTSSLPPFIVQVFDKDPGKNLGNYNSIALSKTLREANIKTKDSSDAGAEKVVFSFHTWQDAKNFVENDLNRVNIQWIGIILNYKILRRHHPPYSGTLYRRGNLGRHWR